MTESRSMKIHEDRYQKARELVHGLKRRYLKDMMTDRNVIGAAFGRRIAHGETMDEPAMVVYVLRKAPQRILPSSVLLPRRMYVGSESVEVDVVETGPIYALAFTARERPATAGISIGHVNVTAGTLGSVVTDNADGSASILSNNHVMADSNSGIVGDQIVQPGVYDGGVAPADTIATLRRFVTINAAGTNRVDAAIGLITGQVNNKVHNNIFPVASVAHRAVGLLFAGGCNRTIMNPISDVLSQLNISLPAGAGSTTAADIGMDVEKVGRTTEYTTSTIKEIDATVSVGGYSFGSATFDGQITTAWMSDGGDSGSLVYQGGAGGDENKCGCPIMSAAGSLLTTDVTQDWFMAEVVRDKLLRQTKIGKFAVDMLYLNAEILLERFRLAHVDENDRKYARKLYQKYIEDIRHVFVEGEKSKRCLTELHLNDAKLALKRAHKYMGDDERLAANQIFDLVSKHGKGKNVRDILALLNDEMLFKQVKEIVAKVKSLKVVR